MSLFALFFRDQMQSDDMPTHSKAVLNEFDNLVSQISAWGLVQHNEDGSHSTLTTAGLGFVPVGGMVRWSLTTPPANWLLANGAAISRAAYPKLFQTLGTTSGAGDGSTTFNLPNVANFIILAA